LSSLPLLVLLVLVDLLALVKRFKPLLALRLP
jgi:hypothetical protein